MPLYPMIDNFDTDSSKIYGSYSVTSADAAKSDVTAYAGRMQSKAYNAGTVTEGGDQPPVIEEYLKSRLISRLEVKDASYGAQWSIAESFNIGDKAFGDREHVIASVPGDIMDSEHIITACNSKNTDSDLAVLTAGADIIVFVALDQRVTNPPSWLNDFARQYDVITINDSEAERPFELYAKVVYCGQTVTLGTNGMSGACMNYTAFVKEYPHVIPTTTTTSTTTTTTTTTTTAPVPTGMAGDTNCDGKVELADALLIMQALANPNKYGIGGTYEKCMTEEGKNNGDVDKSVVGLTSNDALRIQEYLLHKVDTL